MILVLCRKIANFSDKGINLWWIKALLTLEKNGGVVNVKLLAPQGRVKKIF
jgi:hypothetical protein